MRRAPLIGRVRAGGTSGRGGAGGAGGRSGGGDAGGAGGAGASIGLVAACHPLPTAAVTAFATATAFVAGLGGARTALLGAAVLLGQLSVGWCNDYVDRDRDRRAERPEKPIVRGAVSQRAVGGAAAGAAAACVPLSLLLGLRPGAVHLLAVAAAWAYNLRLKSTLISPLPYLVSFALVPPTLVAASLPGSPAVRWPVALATGVLGVSAHFANTVGDEQADRRTAVRGLPQRLGPQRSIVVSSVTLVLGGVLLLLGTAASWSALAGGAGMAIGVAGGALALRYPTAGSRLAFRLNLAAAALLVLAFLGSGSRLIAR